MKLHRQFLLLHSRYGEQQINQVTLDEVAEVLDCTHRNALNIIGRMRQQGWVDWQSQRGRGKRSLLTFAVSPEQIALESMMQTIRRGDIRTSIEQIRQQARSPELDGQLQEWLLSYFGAHSEMQQDRQIDRLRLPIRQQIHTVDPLYMNLLAESFVCSHIFDGLVRKDSSTGVIVPHLAHAWEVDESRTGWTFYLRKDVLFHHGQTLTADDVVYTFQRLMNSAQPSLYRFIFRQLERVQALHDAAVHIQLRQPNELFLPFLCTSRAGIVPQGLNRRPEMEFGLRPSGTGPFRLVEREDNVVMLEAFKPYFQGRPHLDRVEIVHIPWRTRRLEDDADGVGDPVSPFQVIPNPAAASHPDTWSQLPSPVSVRKFVTFNTEKDGLLQQPDVRRHICECLQSFAEDDVADHHTVTVDSRTVLAHAEAASCLRILTIPQYRRDANRIANRLRLAGYDCDVRSVPVEHFKGDVRLESDLILFSLIRDQDEQLRLYDLYQTLSGHVERHTQIDIEHRLQDIQRQPDPQRRTELFAHIQQRLVSGYQLHVLYEKPVQTAYLPTVRGITFNSQGWVDLRHIWFPPQL